MLTYTQRIPQDSNVTIHRTLALTADERVRSRHYFESDGQAVYLQLPRGSILHHGDLLQSSENSSVLQVIAKPEPVLTVTATTPLLLLKAAYHLGNRHVALEVTRTYLRLSPDPVLRSMLEQMGLQIIEEVAPFQPEAGAYGHRQSSSSTAHTHEAHTHTHSHGEHAHGYPSHDH
ncbi:urease accessory protein UreE [Oscillatoria sp. FACHB-1407]|uniref:urease accessory protein UreE n=1 Tax=Oscillatoria sp. FACHB-1407 TaxID=2692847 RepID=UPI001682B4EA|nr:urease accessory protein UreE [Oscillatoria sp. FACHB-1407]MBD2462527.1 urease accessory protein UreE [Oscillatoria sp. FACHB-1407]